MVQDLVSNNLGHLLELSAIVRWESGLLCSMCSDVNNTGTLEHSIPGDLSGPTLRSEGIQYLEAPKGKSRLCRVRLSGLCPWDFEAITDTCSQETLVF